jgi:hypothetical protein
VPLAVHVDFESIMVKLSKTSLPIFHTFIVEPDDSFRPRSWQDLPTKYRIIEVAGKQRLPGKIDAWRFNFNHSAMTSGNTRRWAISVRGTAELNAGNC